ncbi:hypothetical protein ACFY36_02765 [Actinoplanes sp. NPDC000266]
MSLDVRAYFRDTGGNLCLPDLPDGLSTLAGGEDTRRSLWSAPVVRALGATYLPRLADDNLFIPYEETGPFLRECALLLMNLPAVAAGVRLQPTAEANEWYVERNIVNVIAVTHWARGNDYGVLIW